MQKKRIMSAVIAAALSATMTVPAFAAAPTFSDVPASHWAYTAIEKAAGAKMVGGIGNGKYSPTGTVTGGQLLAMLTRYFCPSDIETDAAVLEQAGCSGKWYSGNWYAALKNGYLDGLEKSGLNLDVPVTREQMVAILYNVAGHPEADTSALSPFNDKNQVAAYAVNGFAWAVSNKVVGGTSNTTLSPSGTATRAQIAVIQIRYLENVVGATFPEVTPSQPETKPEQGDATTVPSDVNAYIKTLPETVQSGIALVYDDLYFSDPAEIQAAGIGKRADKPTLGYTATANQNGYHTECTLDLSGAVLDYDGLAVLNRYRAESGKNCGDAVWAYGDMTEEQALAGAKYHDRTGVIWAAILTEADSVEEAFANYDRAGVLGSFIGETPNVVAMAHYTEADGKTYYALVGCEDHYNPCGDVAAAKINYCIK